jgi:hypothetical protein
VLTKKLHKGGVIQTFPGAPHGERTQRATPNRLEEGFKSNTRESINQSRHKCFLWWTSEELSQGALISHLKCSHTQTLGEILDWSAWEGVGRERLKLWRCSNGLEMEP